jgi:3-hydroxybutyryl-CoA dehydrogenase
MEFQRVGVAGLGLLGRGIAACFLGHGFHVVAFTRSQPTREAARDYIETAIGDLIEQAGFPPQLAEEWAGRYQAVDTLESFAECDFVVETIVEDPAAKESLFDRIEAVVRPEVPIASNTSALPISSLQRNRRHPERLVGMHWAEPSHATRFMELIRGERTSDEVFRRVERLARAIGKDPSLVEKDVPAFIVNRIGYAMYREAVHILEMGVADAETIDRSFRNAVGLWATMCGPFRWIDMTGGPALYARALARVAPSLYNSAELPETLRRMIEADAAGTADGHGFYRYEDEQEVRRWEELFRRHAWTIRRLQDEYFPLETDSEGEAT